MTAPYYDGDDVDRIARDFIAHQSEQDRVHDDAAYFLDEIRRDLIAAEAARLLHESTVPGMEPPDDRALRRLQELYRADPRVLLQVTVDAIWYGGPSATEAARAELIGLNEFDGLLQTPSGYVGKRRKPYDHETEGL